MAQACASSIAKAATVTVEQLQGFRYLDRVAKLLSKLHECGCDRDKAGNRELHFDDYVLLVLLYLFNPLIESMRMLQKVSELPELQERLGIKRFSLGSFSESCRVFEPAMLQAVVDQLAKDLLPIDRKGLLQQLPGKLTLVDSTVIQTLCTVAEAMFLPLGDGRHSHAWRLHLQFDVDHHVPGKWEITEPKNTGKSDEKSVLRRNLAQGHTYVMDRWYAQFTLWNDIKAAGSSYVCRVRDNSTYDVLRIVTDLMDTPAHVIAFLYEYRWMIEVFFRFFKQILGCRHLISTRIEGIQIQVYAAVICCMLINSLTGKKPNKWMVTLMSLYLQGLATDEDVLRELNKPDNTGVKLRAKEELWKKLGY